MFTKKKNDPVLLIRIIANYQIMIHILFHLILPDAYNKLPEKKHMANPK